MFHRTLYIWIPFLLCLMAFTGPAGNRVKWVVEQNSTLRVKGRSNINSFTCNINVNAEKDTIIFSNDVQQAVSLSGNIQMDVLGFNCHSNLITRDLRKTLRAEEHPMMTIRFLSIQSMPMLKHDKEIIKGCVEVILAGVVKRFDLDYTFSRSASGMVLDGGRSFCFSDFKLSPPRKLAGLIKIKDQFEVNFQLILREI